MFKKFKDKLEEEFKQGPLKFPVSVQQLAQVISPSPSLNSLFDNNASSSATYPPDTFNPSADVFSIGDDEDSQDGASKTLPLHSIDLTASSPSNMTQNRSRRSSLSSVTSEASSLFPIYENPTGQNYFQSDLESEMEDGMPSQLEKIPKEQLYQSYKKIFNRYYKYKGRYVELLRHYKELQHDNVKTKNVLQESQDKALRRIAELKEQCQLEQNAKAHLEESLRNDVEDRDHMITTLKTKISLLRAGGTGDGLLVDTIDKDAIIEDISENKDVRDELEKMKSENDNLRKEIADLKKLKETACHLIHRCDTTIDEATEDVNNENLKVKLSELKGEIQKMKSGNESLSHLLSRNIITEEDKKTQNNVENNLLVDLSGLDSSQNDQKSDEKDRKIEKLNNLLLKCKEKISSLNAEVKNKSSIIEEKNKKMKEVAEELETNKKAVSILTVEIESLRVREEENVLSVAENKMAIHKELETKEEQIRALTKELKTSENEFRKEKDELIKKYEEKMKEMTEGFARELKYKNEENEKLTEDLKSKRESISDFKSDDSAEKVKEWETEFKKMFDTVKKERSYEDFIDTKVAEIERASYKLEERVSTVQKKLLNLIQIKQKELDNSRTKLKEVLENRDKMINEMRDNFYAEHKGSVEKLSLEIKNLTRKIEELETAQIDLQRRYDEEKGEKEKLSEEMKKLEDEVKAAAELRERIKDLESENERMKSEYSNAEKENARLKEEFRDQSEKIKSEKNGECLEKMSLEKDEAESKLRQYVENYGKLEAENQRLTSDLSQKCGRLVKDLNDSKEKIKLLENENRSKADEIDELKRDLAKAAEDKIACSSENEKIRCELHGAKQEIEESREATKELQAANKELSEKYENATVQLNSATSERSDMREKQSAAEKENSQLRERLKELEEKVEEANDLAAHREEEFGEKLGAKTAESEALEIRLSEQLNVVGDLTEKLRNEKAMRDELTRKLEEEANEKKRLQVEVEELKRDRDRAERELRELEIEREEAKKASLEMAESNAARTDLLKAENEKLSGELSAAAARIEDLMCAASEKSDESERLNLALTQEKSENEKLRLDLEQSEKSKSAAEERARELTEEKNEMSNSMQVKLNEFETLRNSLTSTAEELKAKIRALEEEKLRLASENENKLNVLKNEIKFINDKFEEDIGNIEQNTSMEVNELNSRLESAEKTSSELLQKLEKITAERDEALASLEEGASTHREAERDRRQPASGKECSTGQEKRKEEEEEEEEDETGSYQSELLKKDDEIRSLRSKLQEYVQLMQNLKETNERLKNLENDATEADADLKTETEETEETETGKEIAVLKAEDTRGRPAGNEEEFVGPEVGEIAQKSMREPLAAEKESEVQPETETDSSDDFRQKFIQQAAEIRELKKQHKREVSELRKIIAVKRKSRRNSAENTDWGGTLDNDMEHEYLRNILYEYMMGREQLVLAKVLSAIVKFDKQQTRNVLEKEQHRQTLFGQLGIL